jgi:tRNA modification GTPase
MLPTDSDPIVAIATAPGRAGVGVVRISGASIGAIVDGVLGARRAERLQPRHATYCRFLDARGRALDDGIAILYPAPHSYTGETVLELQGHGGPVVLRLLLARCLEAGRELGARVAEPGEFTRRAFLNERLDLAQAEAVADLIEAGSEAAARSAVRSLAGEFSRAARALADELVDLRALTEATLDFPDEEIDFLEAADARGRLQRAAQALAGLRTRARQGAVLREGLAVALVGAPNVGKSSLLNALAGDDVAIVTPLPGTTRDRIERRIEIDGIVLNVIDTAGLRDTSDAIEKIGIERTLAAAAQADLIVQVVDAAEREPTAPGAAAALLAPAAGRAARLIVCNKIDLSGDAPGARDGRIYLSAMTGAGLPSLRRELLRVAGWEGDASGETVFLAHERHLQALAQAAHHLESAQAQARVERLELFAEELRLAAGALGQITGEVSTEDLLGRIFSRFCIGK